MGRWAGKENLNFRLSPYYFYADELSVHDVICLKGERYEILEPSQSFILHNLPEQPWEKISVDMFHVQIDHYLVTVNYYKRLPVCLFFKNGDLDLCITLPHSIHTEYYAEAWGVSKEGVSSGEKAKKKWIVHV